MAEKDEVTRPNQPRAPRQNSGNESVSRGGNSRAPRPTTSSGPRGRGRAKPTSSASSRPGRSSNQNSVTAKSPTRVSWTIGGLTISVRALSVILLTGLVAIILIPTSLQWADQERQYRATMAELETAKEEQNKLQEELDNWSNKDYIASQARSRLGYVEKGETQFSVVDPGDEAKSESQVATTSPDGPTKPWTMNLEETLSQLDQPTSGNGNGDK